MFRNIKNVCIVPILCILNTCSYYKRIKKSFEKHCSTIDDDSKTSE